MDGGTIRPVRHRRQHKPGNHRGQKPEQHFVHMPFTRGSQTRRTNPERQHDNPGRNSQARKPGGAEKKRAEAVRKQGRQRNGRPSPQSVTHYSSLHPCIPVFTRSSSHVHTFGHCTGKNGRASQSDTHYSASYPRTGIYGPGACSNRKASCASGGAVSSEGPVAPPTPISTGSRRIS